MTILIETYIKKNKVLTEMWKQLGKNKMTTALLYTAISFIHLFINQSCMVFLVVCEEKGNHFANVLKTMCSHI